MNTRAIVFFFFSLLTLLTVCRRALAQWTEPLPVTEINTQYEEWNPFLSYDGLTLYFARGETNTFHDFRIYEATRDEPFGPFTLVTEISELNAPDDVYAPWVSPDNLRMYYSEETGSRFILKLSERVSDADPWPPGTNISELNVLGKHLHAATLSADELLIVFNSFDIPGGLGGYDIWMAVRPDRNSPFGNIRNLSEINTPFYDQRPFISPDGLTLYFNSNRNGQNQIFKTTRSSIDESFGPAEHLALFDTPAGGSAHPAISSDGMTFYFVGPGQGADIWVSYLLPQEVAVDIKPGSCPNPLNLASRGVLPVAVLGSEDFDVSSIDVASVRLAGIAPVRSSYEDVAAPVVDGNECECNTEEPDGFTDLTLKFKTQEVIEELANSLGELADGEELILTLTGALSDHTPIEGEDCIIVRGKVPKPLIAKKSDINEDGIVNICDLAAIANNWLENTVIEY